MRLKQHLNESWVGKIDPSILDDIKKDCKTYLNQVKRVLGLKKHFLFRGVGYDNNETYFKGKVRKDRRPTDSTDAWHKATNYVLYQQFKVFPRSQSLFCKLETPTSYGYRDMMIFPIGPNYYIWSTSVRDLYMHDPENDNAHWEDLIDTAREVIDDNYHKGTFSQCAKSVNKIARGGTEVSCFCNEYYAVNELYEEQIYEWIKNEI